MVELTLLNRKRFHTHLSNNSTSTLKKSIEMFYCLLNVGTSIDFSVKMLRYAFFLFFFGHFSDSDLINKHY